MAKQLNVNLSFNADTKQAKADIEALSKALQAIAKMPGNASSLFDDTEIKKASQAALELQQHLSKAVNTDTGKLDLSRFSSSLKASNKDLSTYCNTLLKTGQQGQQAFLQLAKAIASADTPVTRVNKKLAEMGTTLKNTARWQISSSILHGFMGSIQSAYGYAQDLNKSLNDIRIVTGQNIEQMSEFAVEANRAAKALSTTTTDYTNASLIYFQQGLSSEEVAKRTEVTVKMANAAGVSAQVASDQLTAVWNNFYDGSKSLEYYADVMTALGAATASSTDEIAGGLEKFAAIGETIGLSYEYAASALATITSNTRQSEEVVGTALKTIFARIQGLNLGETLDDGTTLNKYSAALEKVGISIFQQNGEIKKMDDILDEMASKWGTLAKDQQIALAQTVAGVRQYTQLVALMDNWDAGDSDSMVANLNTSYNASGTLQEQADIYAESWEAAQDRVRAAAENIYDSLINDEFFIDILNGFEKVLESVGGFVDGLGGLKGIIGVVGSLFLTNFAQKMPEALNNLKLNLMVLTGQSKKVMSQMQSDLNIVLKEQQANPALSESYKIQLEGIAKVNSMKEKLVLASKSLTEQEKAEYQAKIDNVAAMYEEIAALAEKKKAAEQAAKAAEKTATKNASRTSTGVFEDYNKQQDKISNLETKASDPNVSQDQSAAYTQALETTRQKAVELELQIEAVKEAYSLTDDEVDALIGTSTDQEKLAQAQKKIEEAVKNTTKSFTDQIKQRSNLEGISTSVKSQARAWQEVAKEIKKAQAEGNTQNLNKHIDETKQKMSQYLQVLKQLAQDNGIELTEQELAEMATAINGINVDNVDQVTDKFNNLAQVISSRADTAIDTLDASIDELRSDMAAMQFNENEIVEMEQSAERAAEATQELSNSMSNIGGLADENVQGTFKMSVALTEFASTAMSVSSLITSVQSAMRVFADEGATGFEKFGAALSMIMPLLSTYNALQALSTTLSKQDQIAKLGAAAGQMAANAMAAIGIGVKNAETGAVVANTAAWYANPIMWIALIIVGVIAALTALVAAIGAVSKALIDAHNADANGAKEAAEQVEVLTERYEELKNKAQELNDAIADYQDARNALEDLEKGTDEYAEALENANQKARDLIETYGLWDQYEYKDGLITFKDGVLEQVQKKADDAANQAQVQMYQGNIYSNQANLRDETTNVRRFANKGYGSITNEETQIIAEVATELKESLGGVTPTAEQLIARLEELGASSGLEAQTLANLSHVIDNNTVPKFLSLGESMSEAAKANKYYAEQILGMEVENAYGDDVRRMATDKDGNIDTNKYNQILNAFTDRASQIEEQKGKDIASEYEAVEETVKDISTEGELNRFLKNQDDKAIKQVLGENYDGKINNDKELGLLYASMMSGIDPSELTYVKGNGVGTVKDKEGNEIVSGVSDEVMRREIAKQVAMQGITDNYASTVGENEDGLNQLKTALDTMLSGAAKAADKYGVDFSSAILDAVANENFDSLDFSGLFSELSPEEMAELSGLDSQGILDMLDLDPATLEALGYDVDTFTNAFSNALDNWTYTLDTTDIEEKAAGLKDIADGIKVGDIIDQEAIDKLQAAGVNTSRYFTQMEDGTYKLTGAAKEFQNVIENITVQDYINQIKEFEAANEYAKNQISEQYGFRNADIITDTSQVGGSQTLGAARADYIKTFDGDFGFTEEQQALLTKDSSQYTTEDLQELANMMDIVMNKSSELAGQMLSTADSLDELNNRVQLAQMAGVEISYEEYSKNLIGLASSYENCTEEIERYQVALMNANEEEVYAAECQLKSSIRIGEAAEKYDLSAESLETQARELMIANEWGAEYAETAAMMAISNQRMNKGMEKLAKGWKDWRKTLKSTEKTSQDYADTLVELSAAVTDLVGWYDDLSLSSKFVEKNMNLIEKASTGDVNAIMQLGAAVASYEVEQAQLNETIASGLMADGSKNAFDVYRESIEGATTAADAFVQLQGDVQAGFDNIANNIAALSNGSMSLADIFGGQAGLEEWVNHLNAYAAATGMTAQQMQQMLSSVGVTANVQTDYQEQDMTVPSYREEVTNVHYKTMPYTFASGDGMIYTGQTVVPEYTKATVPAEPLQTKGYVEVASISMDGIGESPSVAPPTFTGRQAPSKSSVSAGKPSGGGGGSTPPTPKTASAPAKMDKQEETYKSTVVKRYKELDDELDDLADSYERANREVDKLFGQDRLDAIEKENKLLQEQQKLIEEKAKEAKKYMAIDKAELDEVAKEAGLNFSYDENGNITNYTDQMTNLHNQLAAAENEYNRMVDEYNAAVDAAVAQYGDELPEELADQLETKQQAIEAYEENVLSRIRDTITSVEDAMELYEESKELYEELGLEAEDIANQIKENNYRIISEGLELRITLNEDDLELIEYQLGKLEDDFYSMAEAIALIVGSGTATLGGDGTQLGEYIDNLNHYKNTMEELERAYAAGEITEASYIEGMKEVRSGMLENLQSIQELDDAMMNYYEETLAAGQEELDKYTSKMEHQTAVLEHYMSIMEILGKSQDYESLGVILEAQAKSIGNEAKVAKENYEMLKAQADAKKAAYEAASTPEEAEMLKKEWEAAQVAANEAQDEMLSKTEQWAEAMTAVAQNKLKGLGQALEDALTAGFGGSFDAMTTAMQRANSLQEEYLTTTNQIYETNKLMHTAQKEIEKTSNDVAKRKMKDFITETKQLQDQTKLSKYELDIQKAKYDLLLAEIALEEAQSAKSTVRLQRDSEGNFGYVYTADKTAVDNAQQAFEDAQNNLYNIGLEGTNNYTQKYQETLNEFYDTMTSLQEQYLNGEFQNEGEYQAAMQSAREFYYAKLQEYSSLNSVALSTDARVVEDAWTKEFRGMTQQTDLWMQNVDGYVRNVMGVFDEWQTQMAEVRKTTVGPDLVALKENTQEIVEASDALAEAVTKDGGVIDALEKEYNAVSKITGAYAQYRDIIADLITQYDGFMGRITTTVNTAAGTGNSSPTPGPEGFASGGYTGEWGPGGKIAMLHQKELILKEGDTENFLASLEVLRDIVKVIDLHAMNAQLGGLLNSPQYHDYEGTREVLEQQVHIEASFPNVSDRHEIEEALTTLVNKASQFTGRL